MKTILVTLVMFYAVALQAQQAAFQAEVSATAVSVAQSLRVTFTLSNAEGTNFRPPSFEGFKVIGGPSTASRVSIINGKRSQEKSWSYTLLATAPGRYTIGKAQIQVGNGRYETQEIIIDVRKASAQPEISADFGLIATLDTSRCYVGQQIVLSYKLIARKSISDQSVLSQDDYEGLDAEVSTISYDQQGEYINGKRYTTKIIHQVILHPQQADTIIIEPLVLRLDVPIRSSSFFTRTKAINVSSAPLKLVVMPKPSGARNLAVGTYRLEARLETTRIKQSDATMLNLTLRGSGNLDELGDPILKDTEGVDVYDPEVSGVTHYREGRKLFKKKEYTYPIVPLASGQFDLRPYIEYYDVDSQRVIQKSIDSLILDVLPAENGLAQSREEMESRQMDIAMRPVQLGRLRSKDRYFFGSGWFYSLLGLGLLPVIARYREQKQKKAWSSLSAEERRRRKAWRKVESHFADLESKIEEISPRQFYDEAGHSFESYLSAKLKIPASDFSESLVIKRLQDRHLPTALLEEVRSLFKASRESRFAPMRSDSDPKLLFAQLKELIIKLESEMRS